MSATRLRKIGAALIWLLAIECVAAMPAPDTTIVPGKSVGPIAVGELLSKIEQRFGQSELRDTAMGRLREAWPVDKQGDGRLEIFARRPDQHHFVVERVRTTSARYSLVGGLAVGSLYSEIRKHFPDLALIATYKSEPRGQMIEVYDSIERGVAFEIAEPRTGEAARCSGIIIHAPKSNLNVNGDESLQW